jgi:hypothetical protein
MYPPELTVSEENKGPIIVVTLIPHHRSNLIKGTSCISLEFSDEQYLLFWAFKCPLK